MMASELPSEDVGSRNCAGGDDGVNPTIRFPAPKEAGIIDPACEGTEMLKIIPL